MKNQTFTVDRGQLDDHENIFFFELKPISLEKRVLKVFPPMRAIDYVR